MANPENKQIPYESTQKDIRDAIESVATAIGGIAIPSADHVSYDNSVSGLSATDVQNALDEIVSDIPTVNNGTLTIQQNGTSKGSFTANSASNVNVNIETPTADKKTATDQFITADGGLLSKCMIDLVPVQSGSGDPYPAGGGKNKFDQSVFSTDVGTTITYLTYATANGTYTMSTPDFPFDGSTCNVFFLAGAVSSGASTSNNGVAINKSITIEVTDGYYTVAYRSTFTINTNNPKDFNFQIEIGSTATPYAPYSNVRPISGHTEVGLQRDGKNLFDVETLVQKPWNGNTTNLQRARMEHCFAFPIGTKITASFDSDFVSTYDYSIMQLPTDFPADSITTETGWIHVDSTTIETVAPYVGINIKRRDNGNIDLTDLKTKKIMFEFGETATPYEPYLGHLYQVQIGSTVYGGYVDLVSGVMTATHASETITSMEYYGTYGVYNAPLFYKDLTNTYVQYGSATAPIANKPISNAYRAISVNDATQLKNNEFRTQQVDTPNRYYFRDDRYNSKAQMDAWLSDNPVQVCGKLATPLTINLTPQQIETLAGQNNLSTPLSGQSIETNGVEYKELFTFADVKEYVNKKIPDAPTTDGTYTLQAVVSGGVPTYSWV